MVFALGLTLDRGEHIREQTEQLLAAHWEGIAATKSPPKWEDAASEREERLAELLQRLVALWSEQHAKGRQELVQRYACGDAEGLAQYLFDRDHWHEYRERGTLNERQLLRARAIESELKQRLIFARNGRMADRVFQLLQLYPRLSFFFAFGAGLL